MDMDLRRFTGVGLEESISRLSGIWSWTLLHVFSDRRVRVGSAKEEGIKGG